MWREPAEGKGGGLGWSVSLVRGRVAGWEGLVRGRVFGLGEKKNHPGGAATSRRSEEVEGLSALSAKIKGGPRLPCTEDRFRKILWFFLWFVLPHP